MESTDPLFLKNYKEEERLANLESYGILDTDPEMCFDQLTRMAAIICKTPIALLSFIDDDRQWFKSTVGMDIQELPRHLTPCNKTLQTDDLYEIHDSSSDEDDCDYHAYMNEQGLRSYAGVPVYSQNNHILGTLCVIDYIPRKLEKDQIDALRLLSSEITDLLEVRRKYLNNLNHLRELSEAAYNTDRKSFQKAHKVSTRAMAELSAGLIYQVKPLADTIKNLSESLEVFHENPDQEISTIKLIAESAEKIVSVMDSLEQFISAEKEKWMKPVELTGVVNDVLNHLEYKLQTYEVTVERKFDFEVRIIGNSAQITEAIFALVNNAIEAVEHSEEKKITIRVLEENRMASIYVEDSGVGVSKEIEPFIFQPFFTTKGSYGTGIGLSLACKLAQNHSGDLELVKNSHPTTFLMSLPLP